MRLDLVRELKASAQSLFVADGRGREVDHPVDLPGGGVLLPPRAFALDMPARRLNRSPVALFALGVAASQRRADGFRLAVRIQHRTLQKSPAREEVIRLSRGEADVRYIGPVIKRSVPWGRQRHRPLLIGTSIAHAAVTAGSLGAFVTKRRGAAVYVLSNNHVLADENQGSAGDQILQPGPADRGTARSAVATLDRFVPLRAGGASDLVDCALG